MYRSYKQFIGYSTAFRQWKADSHCNYIHGYALCFKVWFEGELDDQIILNDHNGKYLRKHEYMILFWGFLALYKLAPRY